MNNLNQIISHFSITGTVADVKPLGNGLINDTYKIPQPRPMHPTMCFSVSTIRYSPMSTCCSTTSRRLPHISVSCS